MEELALAGETDPASVERLAALRADMADKKEELAGLNARWEAEKARLNRSATSGPKSTNCVPRPKSPNARGTSRRRRASSTARSRPWSGN